MTDTITPASLRAHADWFDTTFEPGSVEARSLRNCAARLEAESARDEEAERYAEVQNAAECAVFPGVWIPFDETGPNHRKTILAGVRAVLDRLAADGRLLPEGGTALEREYDDHRDADGNRWTTTPGAECPMRPGECVMCLPAPRVLDTQHQQGQIEPAAMPVGWYRALDPTFATEHFNFPCAAEYGDQHVATDGGRWVWNSRMELWELSEYPPAVSVPDGVPDGTPEKPWETWQDVPEGVRYMSPVRVNDPWVNRGPVRYLASTTRGEIASIATEETMTRLAPFVRVDGDKA
ncbi:hypothetical protein 7S2_22 [uncultured Caudovirales phage]|uniref:Uncharacterized protein n=1 Tax=uncultured Caudovirales phage TaxID=2100421 RepID=A0A2H4J9U3_9CAUD|nr:hypothetical protein 7S2_22 [uncultured Caudovirales phage]